MAEIYPLLVEPRFDERIWGGHKLAQLLGNAAPEENRIGEAWEIYEENRVLNGPYKGRTIGELREELGAELMGHVPSDQLFPLLTKLIDACDVLSVQVHPDDAYAQKKLGQPYGKTECWYIIDAEPGAELIYGFAKDIRPDDYTELVAKGRLEDVLRSLPVKAGDVVYLPARVVHAIGRGILLFELQQTSDVTYRIYDWNRVDSNGKPRELHVEQALEVLDFEAWTRGIVTPLRSQDGHRSTLVAARYFLLELLEGDSLIEMSTYGSPVAVCTLEQPVFARTGQGAQTAVLPRYSSLLIPAAAQTYTLEPAGDAGHFRALVAYVPRGVDETRRDLRDRGFQDTEIDEYLRQFEPVDPSA